MTSHQDKGEPDEPDEPARGRPRTGRTVKTVSVALPPSMIEELDRRAEAQDCSRSHAVYLLLAQAMVL